MHVRLVAGGHDEDVVVVRVEGPDQLGYAARLRRIELDRFFPELSEEHDLALQMPERAKQLHAELMAWVKDTGAPVPTVPNPKFAP